MLGSQPSPKIFNKACAKRKQGAMGTRHPAGGERDLYRMIERDALQVFLSVFCHKSLPILTYCLVCPVFVRVYSINRVDISIPLSQQCRYTSVLFQYRNREPSHTQELNQPDPTPIMTPTPDDDPHPAPHLSGPVELELIDPLELLNESDHTKVKTWSAAVFSQLTATGSVRAKVVNDQQMSAAHKKFSGIEGTTDVLTFDLAPQGSTENFEHKVLDTDLIICIDEAARQAEQHNHSPAHELLLYIIHGTLHCLGYDDHTDKDFKAMHDKEDQLLTAAGIGPLFGRGTHS